MRMLPAVPPQAQRPLLGKAVTGTSIDERPRAALGRLQVGERRLCSVLGRSLRVGKGLVMGSFRPLGLDDHIAIDRSAGWCN